MMFKLQSTLMQILGSHTFRIIYKLSRKCAARKTILCTTELTEYKSQSNGILTKPEAIVKKLLSNRFIIETWSGLVMCLICHREFLPTCRCDCSVCI